MSDKGDRIVLDDPHGPLSEEQKEAARRWFEEVMSSRLNDPNAKIVVIMSRSHEADILGVTLTDVPYEHVKVPFKEGE